MDDKIYVGQTVDRDKRWRDHKIMLNANKHRNLYLQSAYNKYGSAAFIYTVLERVAWLHLLSEREQYWLDATRSSNREFGYNMLPVAGSPLGYKHNDTMKSKISILHKGAKRSEEFKLKISKSWEARTVSDEARANMSKAHVGHKHSAETLLKFKNRTFTDEQRLKLSESAKRRWQKKDGNIGKKKQNLS